jgi:phospholipid/cholesterol/gamma-HCH transport system permease protein
MRFLSDVVLFWRVSQDQTTRALKMTAKLETRSEPDGTLNVALMGRWQTGRKNPSGMDAQQLLSASGVKRVQFDSRQLDEWDSSLVVFLSALAARGAASGVDVDPAGLPAGARRLLDLSRAVPPKADATASHNQSSLLARIGELGLRTTQSVKDTLDFTGELALSVMRLIQGKARFRMVDVLEAIQQCGWQALPIVSLISLLVGLILAFMGAVQLSMFGAQIYVANLVGIGMTREMGAVMTGVIMAGRTGAAFAANLGTMQVNEEIDALQTLGVSPMDYLVIPRMAALVLMMPLLCIYADFMGILGGMIVGVGAFDISAIQYLTQTRGSLTITHIGFGVFKSVIFGLIVAMCGCMQGMRCGRSAAAVGDATTSAVVIAIVYIVVADGLFAVLTNIMGI